LSEYGFLGDEFERLLYYKDLQGGLLFTQPAFLVPFCMRHPSLGSFLLLRSQSLGLVDCEARGLIFML
jgi:hypothetical protein